MMLQPQRHKSVAMRLESKDASTGLVTVTYTGTLEENRKKRVNDAKEWCRVAILKRYPEYKQTNAALGIYDNTKKQEIIDGIRAYRSYCDIKELELNAAITLDNIWAVHINFDDVE